MSGKTIAFASTVQAGPTVPAQDATADVGERDVLGNKADTKPSTATAANSTLSLAAYIKALWDLLRSITFTNLDATISSRAPATDTASILTNADAKISSRAAGSLNDEGAFITATTSASQGVLGSYVQVVASTAHTVRGIGIEIYSTAGHDIRVVIATGGAGSEVVKSTCRHKRNTTCASWYYFPVDESRIPKGVRVAVAASDESAAAADAVEVAITLQEMND